MNRKQKRSRSLNWDEDEKLLFRSVLKEYAHVIENKSLNTNTNKKKTEAWDEIHKKFNELNRRHRQLSQLKIQWKSMKVNVRKSYSIFRNECDKTGGGARSATPDDSDGIMLKRRIMPTHIPKNSFKFRKVQDRDDYINSMICHSKTLKEEDHRRRLEMAEKEHKITMAIQEEKLRSAILERKILERKLQMIE